MKVSKLIQRLFGKKIKPERSHALPFVEDETLVMIHDDGDLSKITDDDAVNELASHKVMVSEENSRWKIWVRYYNHDGKQVGCGVHPTDYAHRSSALRRAKQLWGQHGANPMVEWTISLTNPFVEADNVSTNKS